MVRLVARRPPTPPALAIRPRPAHTDPQPPRRHSQKCVPAFPVFLVQSLDDMMKSDAKVAPVAGGRGPRSRGKASTSRRTTAQPSPAPRGDGRRPPGQHGRARRGGVRTGAEGEGRLEARRRRHLQHCARVRRRPAPSVVATGPAAINQAMKAIAIARKYLLDETPSVDMTIKPHFEEDIRQSSRLLRAPQIAPSQVHSLEDDLVQRHDRPRWSGRHGGAGARRRIGGLHDQQAGAGADCDQGLALAQTYVEEEGMDIKFTVSIVDLENFISALTP